jgi:DNA-binding response OmpR family regulator
MSGRVLIVEDDESVRTVFVRSLRAQGIESDPLSDGGSAVEAIRSGRYGVVLLGLRLPVTSGYQILQAIRDDPRKPVILVLSASSEDVRQVEGDRSVMMCINKTFALRNLDPVIAAIVAVTRMRAGTASR